jgi:hemoglobin-like flavoprotein
LIVHYSSVVNPRPYPNNIISVTCIILFVLISYIYTEVAPAVRPLFKSPRAVQGKALFKMIGVAVSVLNDGPTLRGALENLARGHKKYGVVAGHYQVVGENLLWTLKKTLGAEFTPDVEKSWLKIYCFMLKVILPVAAEEDVKA